MTSTNNPVLKFQILINGTPAILNPFVPGTTDPTTEAMPTGFAQGPNIALAMGIPQDGITPTDFNYGHNDSASWNLRYIWNKTATTKSGVLVASQGIQMPGAPGTYQIVMDGIQVPPGTQLVALGIGFSGVVQASLTADTHLSNRPNSAYGTTAPNFVWNKATTASGNGSQGTGGLLLPAQTTWASVTGTANGVKLIARRSIIDPSSCNTCHENLGNFTTNGTSAIPSFHGNEFNDGSACVFCHYATGTTGGWTYDAKTWVHALHAGGFRSNAYTAQSNFPGILYPGILNDCEACHVPGSYDFSNSTNAGQISGMLWPTVASGTLAATGNSPWVTPSGNYGATQSFVAPAPATAAWVTAQPANYALSAVTSPITSACGACHDSAAAVSHMTANGGTWYVQRGSVPVKNANGSFTTPTTAPSPIVLASNEQCLVCHGSGGVADIDVVHMNF
jgi:OmcA/MtrC family decaheme c-type cytochrome